MTEPQKSPRRGGGIGMAYPVELEAEILALAAGGLGLDAIAQQPGMPTRVTMDRWRRERPQFGAAYLVATGRQGRSRRPTKPTEYTNDLAHEICLRVAQGEALGDICRASLRMPRLFDVYRWLLAEDVFTVIYEKARMLAAFGLVEDIRGIADGATADDIALQKLRIATRQWEAARLAPGAFGGRSKPPVAKPTPIINLEVVQYGGKADTGGGNPQAIS